jgi:hypothetical protein
VEGHLTTGVYRHPPGRLSRWGVVDVGLKCVHRCRFCYYSFLDGSDDQFAGMQRAEFLPTEHICKLAAGLAANGFIGFDVTGGEPTLHPGIVMLAAQAQAVGLAMRVITLGQYLMRPMKSAPGRGRLVDALLDAGVADFLLSTHAVDEGNFAAITGGSWAKLLAAMEHLDGLGVDYCTNTTVCEQNFRMLPQIAAEIARHRVYAANLIVMNAYYAWSHPGGRARSVQGHYSAVRPYLIGARDILEAAGIAVNVRYAPHCTMRGLERNLVGITGVRHDPHEWMNCIEHTPGPAGPAAPEAMARRLPLNDGEPHYPLRTALSYPGETRVGDHWIIGRRAGKVFPSKCHGCRAAPVCDGIDPNYLERRGDGELQPYGEFRGDLIDRERLAYAPAFVVKTAARADARAVVRQLLGLDDDQVGARADHLAIAPDKAVGEDVRVSV